MSFCNIQIQLGYPQKDRGIRSEIAFKGIVRWKLRWLMSGFNVLFRGAYIFFNLKGLYSLK